MTAAAKAVMTHLRIEPSSKIALMNRGYIKQQPGVTIKDFVEREVSIYVSCVEKCYLYYRILCYCLKEWRKKEKC